MGKTTNPLYVVRDNGKTVEEAKGQLDKLIKKFNLEPVIAMVLSMWQELLKNILAQAETYPLFLAAKKMLDTFVLVLEKFLKDYAPFLFFYRA